MSERKRTPLSDSGKFRKGGTTMNINIIGRQVHVTDDLKELVTKKLSKFDRYFPKGADATVTFRRVRDNECMEITISVTGTLFRAEETSSDFRTSLNRCVDTIEGQIRKNKTRLEKRIREGALDKEFAPVVPIETEEETEFKVVRTKRFAIKPMSVEEAILQMNLLDHEFFVFKNQDDEGAFSIVYKRKDGGYGLIADGEE